MVYVDEKTDLFNIELPAVVKPNDNGSSIGITPVDTLEQLNIAIKNASSYSDNSEILVEERIIGCEFSVTILDRDVLPIIEIIPKQNFYDYENKYQEGFTEEIVPANLSNDMTIKLKK